jgi:hypothetical protein
MTGRNVVQGALAFPGMLNDATLVPAINGISKALGSDYREAPSSQQLDNLMNKAGIPNPQPENATERVVSGIDRGVGGLLGGVGIGGLLRNAVSPAAQGVGNALTSNLGSQTTATGLGVGGGEVARENNVGPAGQLAVGLAGGLSPAIAGAGRQATVSGISRLMAKPSPEVSRLAQVAADNGIPLKASQVSPSQIAKHVDSVSAQVPFSGAGTFQDQQRQAFNRAVSKTIGEDAPKLTSDVMERAKQRIGASYDDLAQRVQTKVTPQVQQQLDDILTNAKQFGNDDSIKAVNSALERVAQQTTGGVLPGPAFKSLDSQLGQIAANGGEKGNYAKQLRGVLREAFSNSAGPEDAAQMKLANQQYANLKTIEPLIAKDSVSGNVSPQALLGRVAANKAGKSAMAFGRRGDLGDLANIGKQFMGEAKDSGTAVRNQVFSGLKTGGKIGAGLLAGSVVGLPSAILGSLGTVKTARSIQKLMQNPALLDQLLGKTPKSQLSRLMLLSADPSAQGVIQAGQ